MEKDEAGHVYGVSRTLNLTARGRTGPVISLLHPPTSPEGFFFNDKSRGTALFIDKSNAMIDDSTIDY